MNTETELSPDHRSNLMPASTRQWAWLALTLLTGLALVASAVHGFVTSRRDSEAVARAAGLALARTVGQEVAHAGDDPQSALDWALETMSDEGLTYAALCDPRGACNAQAGTPSGSPVFPARGEFGPHLGHDPVGPHPVGDGPLMRVVVPMRNRPPPGMRRPPEGHAPGGRFRSLRLLVVEYEPLAARSVRARASAALAVSLGAAVLLLLAAGLVWRLTARAMAYERQLARDRELKKLGEVSAVLGHQLRNPVASLKGHAQLLLERLPAEAPSRPGAETIAAEATRLELLTEQILAFVRTGSIDRRPENPAAVLSAVVEAWPAGQVVLEAEDAPARWLLDRPRLEQALANVIDNAVSVSPPGEPVRVWVGEESGRLVILVRDRGPGLDPGDAEMIFEPFFTRSVKGTGLGLALARRVIEGHGGTVVAKGSPGGGTEIRIELPHS